MAQPQAVGRAKVMAWPRLWPGLRFPKLMAQTMAFGVNLVFYFWKKVFRDPKEIPYVWKGDVFRIFRHTFLNLGWQVRSWQMAKMGLALSARNVLTNHQPHFLHIWSRQPLPLNKRLSMIFVPCSQSYMCQQEYHSELFSSYFSQWYTAYTAATLNFTHCWQDPKGSCWRNLWQGTFRWQRMRKCMD
jgi:hypothetical protein